MSQSIEVFAKKSADIVMKAAIAKGNKIGLDMADSEVRSHIAGLCRKIFRDRLDTILREAQHVSASVGESWALKGLLADLTLIGVDAAKEAAKFDPNVV